MRTLACLLLAVAALAAGGCGDDGQDTLVVSAAVSLTDPFSAYAEGFDGADVRLAFGGSDELAAQIRQGVRPDLFAAANVRLPQDLFEDGLVERPTVFATNELVMAVSATMESGVSSIDDLGRRGMRVAVGAEGVPVGAYTRDVIARLGPERARRVLANVRSEEPDVAGIVGKLTQGGADAGFVYITDVLAAGGRLRAIRLPARVQPSVEYAIALVRGAKHRAEAERFVAGLREGAGANALTDAGFALPGP